MELKTGLESKLLLGRYRVVAQLAEGGMGKVYLARVEGAEGFTKPVVVKVMKADMRSVEEGNRLFSREAQILSKMHHPVVPGILDFGTQDGARIMVLEYVHGYSVSHWLDYRYARQKLIPVDICLLVVRRVLEALHYAHTFEAEGGERIEIVHRDVAADNVLLDRKGYAYLLDFGIASITGKDRRVTAEAGTFRGKLGYAAPETIEGHRATPLSDQYSAGIFLLELLTLEMPFQAETVAETVMRMVREAPPRPSSARSDVSPALDACVARVLSKVPGRRFPSVLQFSHELRRLQSRDDDEVLLELRRTLEADFQKLPAHVGVESLAVREAALARIFPALTPQDGVPELKGAVAAASSERTDVVVARSSKGLLGVLVGLAALIAVALGVVIALLTEDSGEQVVVVGGERRTEFATPSADAAVRAETLEQDSSAQTPPTQAEQLSRAVQEQGPAFERCFVDHLDHAEKAPEAILHFSVPQGGAGATVNVEPGAVARSALGACLKQAAVRVKFPPQATAVSFRVPVRARVAHLK